MDTVLNRVPYMFQIWACKQVMDIAPANGNRPWEKNLCPLCPSSGQVREICLHILFCNHGGWVETLRQSPTYRNALWNRLDYNGSGCERRRWQQRKELRINPPPQFDCYIGSTKFLGRILFPPFLRYPPDHCVRGCVVTKAYIKMETYFNTVGASSSNVWGQCPCFLHPICL